MAEFEDVNKVLAGLLDNLQTQAQMNKLGLAVIRRVQTRTRKGVDVEGRPFKPYSDAYAEKREKAGLPTHVVNLTFNDIDGMMHKMDHVVFKNFSGVEVDILDPEKRKIAAYHDSEGVGKSGANIRHFFGLNDQDESDIGEIVATDINDILTDLTKGLDT